MPLNNSSMKNIKTCYWPGNDKLMVQYHDHEWGNPVHDDAKHFEFILLDTFQAGLSWKTVLHKRTHFKKAFDNFNYKKIAKYEEAKVEELMLNAGIIRNRLKINASISNAKAFMLVQQEFGSFDTYVWQFVNNETIVNKCKSHQDIKATSSESDALSKDLYKRGFKFVGSTIIYAYMQAAGLVNDHLVDCFRYPDL
jgi:DNA-3-methyladenine glycosylase I